MAEVREIAGRSYGACTAMAAVVCAGLIVAAMAPAGSDARQVRAFAVGPKIEIDRWFDTREHYRDKLFALFDRRLRGRPGVPTIQRGAGDVASRLLGPGNPRRPARTARDLVALPEDIGLWAMLVGPRGEQARETPPVPGSSAAAVGSLVTTYAPQFSHYTALYPELGARGVPARALVVALTDTFARVAVETFAELADRHDVYLHAGVNMARDWKIVCSDREAFNRAEPERLPGGVRCEEQNPAKVALLRAPEEPERDYAYEATTPDAVNMGLVFDPAGRLISKQVKAYLTPVELPGVGLDLKPGPVSGLGAVRTPVGTLGVQTSKDAWMPDVQEKHDLRGVDVLVQPEYFVGDTVRSEGPWSADTLHASGYNNVLRRPGVEAMVLPELTGNAFDLAADAQSHIAVRARSRRTPKRRALVGQPRQRGFARVARWIVRDRARPDETIAERRRRLGLAGERMLPGSGVECEDPQRAGPCENGQVEEVISADLRVRRSPARRPYRGRVRATRFSRNRALRPAPRRQRNVALAAQRRLVVAAYEQMRGRRSRVVVTRSRNGGRTFARRVAGPGEGPRQWTPDVAVSGRRVTAAWVEVRRGRQRVNVAVSRNRGRSFRRAVEVPPAPGGGPGAGRQWEPALAALAGGAYLVYLEEADRSSDDDLPQTRVFGRRVAADGSLGPPQRLDGGEPDELAEKLDHAWAPSVAAHGGRATVAWVDFHSYDWRPYARTSEDGGRTFGPQRQLSSGRAPDGTQVLELLADSPSVALDDRGSYVAWTDWRKEEATARRRSRAYDTWIVAERGEGFGDEARADDQGSRQVSTFWPAVAARGGDAFVAWQDSAGAVGDIRLARLVGGEQRRRAVRVDDTGRAGVNQYRPAVALSRGRLVAAWEDERNGPGQIYFAGAPLSRIP